MLPQILAMTVNADPNGAAQVNVGSWPFIIGSLPFVIVIVLIVMLAWYFLNKKRLEHQQIMAAIEKGTPLSELRLPQDKGPNWIINLSAGIGLILMGLGLTAVILAATKCKIEDDSGIALFIALVFLAVGVTRLIRGIIQKKAEKASSDKSALDANHGQ
ncbi:MAG: DUF6249 domain-containing protein [Phycisphaerae bacterium]|nr:DUF6249 domain-containing protein [Phycisphaerae bacterium]